MTELTYIQGGDAGRRVWRRRPGEPSSSAITVLSGQSRQHWVRDPEGAFSIKGMPKGRAIYRTEGASHVLTGSDAVILNQAQPYELEFLDRAGTESFCIFVSDDLIAGAWRDLARLDPAGEEPAAPNAPIPQFPDLVFRPPESIAGELASLRESFGAEDPSELAAEERLLGLVSRLVASAQGHRRVAERLPAAKASTRRLLAGRLERARQLIEDSHGEPTLDELARASALSKFHLLRLFKAAFGARPRPMSAANACTGREGCSAQRR